MAEGEGKGHLQLQASPLWEPPSRPMAFGPTALGVQPEICLVIVSLYWTGPQIHARRADGQAGSIARRRTLQ